MQTERPTSEKSLSGKESTSARPTRGLNPAETGNSIEARTPESVSLAQVADFDQGPWQACIDSIAVLHKSLLFGRIRGIVTIFGDEAFNSEENSPAALLAEELVKRDILVAVSGGCSKSFSKKGLFEEEAIEGTGMGVAEVCDFIGINPIIEMGSVPYPAISVELYQVLADRIGTRIEDLPFAAIGVDRAAATNPRLGLLDKASLMEADATLSADSLDSQIHDKRLQLGWADRFHCSLETYS